MDEPFETWTVAVTADTSELRRELANATALGRQFGRSLTSAFEGVAVRGKSLGDVFRSLALSLSHMVLQAAFKPLGSLLGGLFTSGLGFAKGGIVERAMPTPFAAGGVIASPIAFPLRDGSLGVAGERGAEAILPLARGPDGRLGVAAASAGGIAVTFNVTTPDAESFRRSETQIAAMLARAVAHGQRNL